MAPDRPDASDVESGGGGGGGGRGVVGPVVTRIYGYCETYETKEGDSATEQHFVEETAVPSDEIVIEEVPIFKAENEIKEEKTDDDLTSLTWLHQQNLLKSLEITENVVKKEDNVANNNVGDDSLDTSENTNSMSSADDSFVAADSNEKVPTATSPQFICYDEIVTNGSSPIKNSPEKAVSPIAVAQIKHNNNIESTNDTDNNNSNINANFNLPANNNNNNRNKHPTHIPYDPLVHKNSKPPYSFSCLIFMAIEDSPVKALPVKEVYAWILEHFPYFRNAPTGWKNSVRHNLSLNKCFRKVEKSPNLGKGSLWMVDTQFRPNLIQALSRSPFPPPSSTNLTSPEKNAKKASSNTRLPDPNLFPYLSKRLASSNAGDSTEVEFDSDVDAAAAAMLAFKHGPIIINSPVPSPIKSKERKRKSQDDRVPVITRSSTEDHTYSLVASVRVDRRPGGINTDLLADVEEQRKIAEGADALLNLAGITVRDPLTPNEEEEEEDMLLFGSNRNAPPCVPGSDPLELPPISKRRASTNSNGEVPEKKRKRGWRDTWNANGRIPKQVRG